VLDKLKGDIDEILALVAKCPADLQSTALKAILEEWFKVNAAPAPPIVTPASSAVPNPPKTELPPAVRTFMVANSLSDAQMEKAFQPLGASAQLMVFDVPGQGKANKQISLAVLLSVRQALGSGVFSCRLEDLRTMCLHYNIYDAANFARNLKAKGTLFRPRSRPDDLELSGPGMKQAATIIKEIVAAG
jgi:hypothetical protein